MVHALEDKAGADLIQANNAMLQPQAADTHGTFIAERSNAFNKRQGSLPPEILDRTRNQLMQNTKNNNFVLPSISPNDTGRMVQNATFGQVPDMTTLAGPG